MRTEIALVCITTVLIGSPADAAPKSRSVSGEVVFENDHKPDYMPGYRFVGEGQNGSYLTNKFGAPDAQITVKNAKGEIVGVGSTEADGRFNITVGTSNFYQLTVEYQGRKVEKAAAASDAAKGIQVDVGRFE